MDSKGYNSSCTHCARLNILIMMVASLSTIGSSVPFVRPPQQPTTSLRKLEQQYGSDHADMEALLQFKAHVTNDARGALKEWDAGNNGNLCSWNGVTCSPTKRVIRLELRSMGLEGNFALSSLVQLDMLEVLDLSGNFLRGNLTAELNEVLAERSTCSNLQVLVLSHNYIEGSFPASLLSSCGSIQQLDLSYNNLSGSLPQNMFLQCGSLSALDLSHNHITGTLPDGIGQCSSLQRLVLSFNTLIGKLPMDLLSNCSEQFCTTSHEAAAKPTLKLLDLSSNNLTGPVSDMIFSQCESLVTLDLSSNSFDGEIPPSLQGCNALQNLNLSGNNLGSRLPEALSSLSSIKLLDISNNKIVGPIPTKLGSICPTLVHLDLSSNNISGTLPSSFGSCDSLQYLNLAKNNLSGSFPGEVLSQFKGLEALLLAFNQFTGPFPLELANCRSLKVMELGSNKLSGDIPSTGFCSPTFGLERLSVPNNGFYGEVPASLANCSHLRTLDLSFNHLQGPIPPALGSLSNLDTLFIWYNSLTGEIPKELGRLSNLKNLVLNNNQLSGPIPVELSNCTAIEWLYLSNNQLTGSIPAFLGRLQQLTLLEMANNSFTGNIPSELANVSKFLWVDLNSNYLTGPIPPGLGRHISGPSGPLTGTTYTFLRYLDNGCRGLGTLLEFSGITQDALSSTPFKTLCTSRTYMDDSLNHDSDYSSIHYLDLSYNNLEGSIPEEMGYLGALLMLSLAHNKLVGLIPSSFSHLRSLGVLDLSYNALEGGLGPLANCSFLVQINVSFNHLSGPIPSTGQLSTALPTSYANNSGLCGEPLLVTCSSLENNVSGNCDHAGSCGGRKSGLSVLPWANSIVLGILISVAFMCMLIVWGIMMRAKGKQKDTDNMLGNLQLGSCHGNSSWNLGGEKEPLSINVATFERPLRKLTFAQLIEATNGFSQESLIGIGGFGEVYKAELKDGSTVAIKKLLQFSYQGDREFTAEMETLGKIKHRHLVPLLGYCKVGEERLLVYEYMAEGSLDDMLHGETGRRDRLTWELRKQIARGAAKGLSFLHHNCIPHIIHRDMKSSNVLLDRNLEARLSDFGMARLISALDTHLSVSTLAGTPGYVPPEYYQSFRCTTKGDIYSFGVILLELLTGKRPTDKEAFEDNNLVGWVRQHVSDKRSLQVLDPSLVAPTQQGSSSCPVQLEMLQYLRIACECVEELPSRRPNMLEVVSMFKELQMNEGGD